MGAQALSFERLLGISHPLIQAPMAGGATTPDLVASVSNCGGLGSLGAGYMSPGSIEKNICEIESLTKLPYGVNLFVENAYNFDLEDMQNQLAILNHVCSTLGINLPEVTPPFAPSFNEQIQVILEHKVPVFSFTFGKLEASLIKELQSNGTKVIATATNLQEALVLQDSGVDMLVAQGAEAGGHRGSFLGSEEDGLIKLKQLLLDFKDKISIPYIAAGGIMNRQDIQSALQLGASAVQMGTAFLSCKESGIHPDYKSELINSTNKPTVLTKAFSGKLARGIVNEFILKMQSHEQSVLDYPIQNALTNLLRTQAKQQGIVDYMSMWAGENYTKCRYISAKTLISELFKSGK